MTNPTSNISIVSNIYPTKRIKTVRLPGLPERVTGVIDDPEFRLQIKCKRSLVALSEIARGAVITDQQRIAILRDHRLVSEPQIKAYWDDGRCVDCLRGEKPWGLGKNGLECRCPRYGCHL